MNWKSYRRKGHVEAIPWTPDTNMNNVSVSAEDKLAGSPKTGDYIGRNPNNHNDMWLIAKAYFNQYYEEN